MSDKNKIVIKVTGRYDGLADHVPPVAEAIVVQNGERFYSITPFFEDDDGDTHKVTLESVIDLNINHPGYETCDEALEQARLYADKRRAELLESLVGTDLQ